MYSIKISCALMLTFLVHFPIEKKFSRNAHYAWLLNNPMTTSRLSKPILAPLCIKIIVIGIGLYMSWCFYLLFFLAVCLLS